MSEKIDKLLDELVTLMHTKTVTRFAEIIKEITEQ